MDRAVVVRPVVAGVDGAEGGLRAVDWARDRACRRGASVSLVFVGDGSAGRRPVMAGSDDIRSYAYQALAAAEERAGRHGRTAIKREDLLSEEPVDALLEAGRAAETMVLPAPARSEFTDLMVGCTALAVTGHAKCPVVTVPAEPVSDKAGAYVLLAVPDAGGTAAPEEFAFAEAASRGCPLVIVRAWRAPSAGGPADRTGGAAELVQRHAREAVAGALRAGRPAYPGVTVRPVVCEGSVTAVLLRFSASARLVVTGSRRAGCFGERVGMVPHALVHRAPCPVAIVP